MFLTPRGAFTEPCRPLTFPLSFTGTPESVPAARCATTTHVLFTDRASIDLTCEPRTLLRPGGETRTGRSPETPSIVSRTREPKPTGQSRVRTFGTSRNRAPFRPLSTRAPRQAVLRASFRLAPSRSTRPCDLPARKTRDASNRCLPLVRLACTRTSSVPGVAAAAFTAWMSR